MQAIIGKKIHQTQKFLTDGTRIPVTIVATPGNPVISIKSMEKDGYWAMQLGFGTRKHTGKAIAGHVKKAQLDKAPFKLKEVRLSDKEAAALPEVGSVLEAAMVFEAGDIIDVTGKSKGKGFAGGVKRHHFKGGPRTHGQSDRERAPGSLGQTTTPGRVYKGKRMAAKMGNDTVTLKNLEVIKVGADFIWVRGLVPGSIGEVITIKATGKKNKNYVAVMKTEEELAAEEAARLVAEEEAKKAAEEAAKVAEATAAEEAKKAAEAPVEVVPEASVEEVQPEVSVEEEIKDQPAAEVVEGAGSNQQETKKEVKEEAKEEAK